MNLNERPTVNTSETQTEGLKCFHETANKVLFHSLRLDEIY